MWVEHDGELFNLDRVICMSCISSYDIAIYDQIMDLDSYMQLSFDTTKERDEFYDFVKKSLNTVTYGQANKKSRKESIEEFQDS